jgi:hypothetical protein
VNAGAGVAEVLGEFLDRDTAGEQCRGVELPEAAHAVDTWAVRQPGIAERGLLYHLGEQVPA